MLRNSNVLLPTDFSHYALYAFTYALALARKYESKLQIAHVLDPALFTGGIGHGFGLAKSDLDRVASSMEEHAQSRLAHLCRTAASEGVEAECIIVRGKAPVEIVRLQQERDCDMIVIATHGRTGFDHIVFGSVAEKVVRMSPVPVLTVKHPEHEFVLRDGAGLNFDLKSILFPTDFSELAEKTLPYAASLCKEFDATLTLMHASEAPLVLPEFMPDAASAVGADMEASALEALERIRGDLDGLDVEVKACTGIAHREICRAVRDGHVDLVVMSTHGRSGVGHALFGSVAEKVVRLARCPVLTVRPGGGAPDQPAE